MFKALFNEEKIDKFIFYFSIIDILFLPYIWFVSTNYSLILVFLWCLLRIKKIIKTKEFKISFILSIFIVFSTILSILVYPQYIQSGDEIWIQNIKMMLQYISYFMYFIMFTYCIKIYEIKIKKILLFFLGFATFLAIIYTLNKDWFANIKLLWNNVDSYTNWFKSGEMIQYRYNFIWTDPNNPAYAFVATMAFLLINEKTNIIEKIATIVATTFLLICSMSTGGLVSFVLTILLILIITVLPKVKHIQIKLNKKTIISTIIIALILITILTFIINTAMFKEAMQRMLENTEEGSSSRFDIWLNILSQNNIFRNILLRNRWKTSHHK